jgi:uncharacterized UPF0160 family protein
MPFDDNDAQASLRCFKDAQKSVGMFLNAKVRSLDAQLRAMSLLEKEISDQWGEPILELPFSMDFQVSLDIMGADHVLFVVHPGSSGGFGLTCAREAAGTYKNLVDLPESWAGLTGKNLEEVTGVEGVTFCHSGRFFAAGNTREAMLALAQQALPETPSPSP